MTETTSTEQTYQSAAGYVTGVLKTNGEPVSAYGQEGRRSGMGLGYQVAPHETDKQTVLVTWCAGLIKKATQSEQRTQVESVRDQMTEAGLVTALALTKDKEDRAALVVSVPLSLANTEVYTAYAKAYSYRRQYNRAVAEIAQEIDAVAERATRWAEETRRNAERLREEPTARNANRRVGAVQSDFLWGLANAGLHNLTTRTGDLALEEQAAAQAEADFEAIKARYGHE